MCIVKLSWILANFLSDADYSSCYIQTDRVECNRSLRVGKIEVIRHDVSYSHKAMGYPSDNEVDFVQANKKDVTNVTKSQYTMTTTRQGKLIRDRKPYDKAPGNSKGAARVQRMQTYYNIGDEAGKLHLEYHMTQTLLDWGIKPVRLWWSHMSVYNCQC